MAASLDLDFALFHKERKKANEIARMVLVGNVEGKTAILIDDMADTCGTLVLAAKHLLAGGAKQVYALVTHGILSGKALHNLADSVITKLFVTNSIPQDRHKAQCKILRVLDVSHVLAEAVCVGGFSSLHPPRPHCCIVRSHRTSQPYSHSARSAPVFTAVAATTASPSRPSSPRSRTRCASFPAVPPPPRSVPFPRSAP